MMQLVALLAFMLIPVWIPVITVTFGALFDLVRASEKSELTARMEALHARPAHVRTAPSTATN